MKNVVFIPNINLGDGRNNSYHYSVKAGNIGVITITLSY